ncbi:MAG: hypothetical protein NXY57DRAFT_115062 [Lentinula lateritia]|uniref:Uncharacterized protein n=1 Tax=Lentinula lateritia TaxID=40482 RepID=A0ABQ8V469_9AGAR|nr:MAG: hypothetical protein NXY57DRAFT_115062 [Lentinula lateritia]KAJ4472369.1 hypothetical protein C8R41DRAFT_591678 [Lentinula lateritia]
MFCLPSSLIRFVCMCILIVTLLSVVARAAPLPLYTRFSAGTKADIQLLRKDRNGKDIAPGALVSKDEQLTLYVGNVGFESSLVKGQLKPQMVVSLPREQKETFGKMIFSSDKKLHQVYEELLTLPGKVRFQSTKSELEYLSAIFATLLLMLQKHEATGTLNKVKWIAFYDKVQCAERTGAPC